MQSKQTLNDFPKISLNLRNSTLSAVKALHVVAYGDKGLPRQTRKNLRNFTKFSWDKESEKYSRKIEDVKNKLSMPELVGVCHVLVLNYTGSEDDVIERICSFLNDFNLEDETDDDSDKDAYHEDEEEGKDVTDDDGDNEDNDVNSDKDAYHEDEEEGQDVTDDDSNHDDNREDKRTTDLFTRNRSKSNKMTTGRLNDSFALTFRDVEDSINKIADFEEISNLMR
uniref:Protein PFC0760c-like n=1 Tax=Diabrotica virgifera virgifera TaxID=50390 RepID=A0A6P7GXZ5_DIAVI